MNSQTDRSEPDQIGRRNLQLGLARRVALVGVCALAASLHAQTDNFDTGTDAGWSKVTNSTYPATYSFQADEFGGHAYRLQGSPPPGFIVDANTARAAAYRTDRLYTNFFVAADIVAWDSSSTNGLVFGLLARANPATVASGLIDGAMFIIEINRFRDAGGSRGRAHLMSINAGLAGGPAGLAECTLIPGRKYRLTFGGVSNILSGAIYDLADLTRPILSMTGDDGIAASGFFGGPFPNPGLGGYVGLINLSAVGTGSSTLFAGGNPLTDDLRTDSTFDNFVASELPPVSVAAPATPHGLRGAPQVVNRSPASFANFYPAVGGITFNATTLTTTNAINPNAIRLYLNNVDVSSGLSITGPATNAAVAYHSLAANAVYEARIELQDALGRKTTNRWTFDTFSDAYLASSRAKNIECEDYDFNNGQFIDDPPPSGYATNDINHSAAFNGSGVGYVDLVGSNAKVGGVDFFDYDVNPQTSPYGNENEFRFSNSVGTQLGTVTHLSSDANDPNVIVINRSFDTQRQKYFNVNTNLYDYVVERTEGGEWLNYTRIFTNLNYYNVYLRYNSGLSQQLLLDQIGAGPATNNLGGFTVKSSCAAGNYRYAALTNGSGKLAVVNLSGTNVVRLTMAPPQAGLTKQRTALNYLAFVPALLVESAAVVTGPYTIETSAAVEPGTRYITIAAGSARFYRLRWDHQATITSVRLVGGNVELTYE